MVVGLSEVIIHDMKEEVARGSWMVATFHRAWTWLGLAAPLFFQKEKALSRK